MKKTGKSIAAYAGTCGLAALYMTMALQMYISPTEEGDVMSMADAFRFAFDQPVLINLTIFLLLAALAAVALGVHASGRVSPALAAPPAAFFAVCTWIGLALIEMNWGNLIVRIHRLNIQKWAFCLPAWFILWYCVVLLLYCTFDRTYASCGAVRKRRAAEELYAGHSFAVPLMVILAFYVPVMILSFPGTVVPMDTVNQILQAHGQKPFDLALIYEDSALTNHHPIMHTMLIYLFLRIGQVCFDSAQTGLGLLMCLQVMTTACMQAFVLHELHKEDVPAGLCLVMALYFALHPRIQNMMVLISKDMLYAEFMLLFGIALLRMMKRKASAVWLALIASIGMMLMRNEGVYILLGTMASAFVLMKNHRRAAAAGFAAVLSFWMIWTGVVFPALRISPGSKREMLSVPFQQTGRYVALQAQDVTEEERAAIDGVLKYDEIRDWYRPNLADGVKDLYRESATDEDMAAYWKTWASMFAKRPMTYLEAVLENKNLLLYPSISLAGRENTAHYYGQSQADFYVIARWCEPYGISITYPEKFTDARQWYEQARERIFAVQGLRLLTQNAPVVWMGVLLLYYALYRRKSGTVLLLAPVVLQIMVLFAGPMDGNSFRYIYPLALYLPIPLLTALYKKEE